MSRPKAPLEDMFTPIPEKVSTMHRRDGEMWFPEKGSVKQIEWPEVWLRNPAGRTQHELRQACDWAAGQLDAMAQKLKEKDDHYAVAIGQQAAQIQELKLRLRSVKSELRARVEVTATSKNTSSVRAKFEMGGYLKHYLVQPHTMHTIDEILSKE